MCCLRKIKLVSKQIEIVKQDLMRKDLLAAATAPPCYLLGWLEIESQV